MQKRHLSIEQEIDDTRREIATLLKWVIGLALVFVVPWIGCQIALRNHHLSFVPEAMGVNNVVYVSEKSWGSGPGGNETGILIFDMPEAVANSLETQGIAYLEQLPRNTRTGWEGRYSEWHETPIAMPSDWGSSSFEGSDTGAPQASATISTSMVFLSRWTSTGNSSQTPPFPREGVTMPMAA